MSDYSIYSENHIVMPQEKGHQSECDDLHARIAELERERDAAHDVFKRVNAVKRQMRRERNAASSQAIVIARLWDIVDPDSDKDGDIVMRVRDLKTERDELKNVLQEGERLGWSAAFRGALARAERLETERDAANERAAELELWKRRANTQMEITRAAMEIVNAPFQVYDGRIGLRGYRISANEFENLENAVRQYMDAANAQEAGRASRARDETPPATC